MDDEMSELSVSRNKLESFLPLLEFEVTEDEHIVNPETGEVVTSIKDEKLKIGEIGYIGCGENGSIEPVRDDFSAISEYLSDRE